MTARKIFGIRSSVVIVSAVVFVVAAAIALSPLLRNSAYAGTPTPNPFADTTFPPPLYNNLFDQHLFATAGINYFGLNSCFLAFG